MSDVLDGAPDPRPVLCADDYAMSESVSAAIEELAQMGHLSATSAIVTGRSWRALAPRVAGLKRHIALGLHLNLTWGAPLTPMPSLAPRDSLPSIGEIIRLALTGRVPSEEIAREVEAQLCAFRDVTGSVPCFIDGHEHVHTLPGVRSAVLAGIGRFDPRLHTVLRAPTDALSAIFHRGVAVPKALVVRSLAAGFAKLAREAGHATNEGFSGFSTFSSASPYAGELARFFVALGPRHLIMCHPGHVDATAGADMPAPDVIAIRRGEEYAALKAATWLPQSIWHPPRLASPLWSV